MSTMKRNYSAGGKRIARTVSSGRPSQLPTDFFALGSKAKPMGNDGSGIPPAKKAKLPSSLPTTLSASSPLIRLANAAESVSSRMSPTIPDPSSPCIECPPVELVPRVLKYADVDLSQVKGLLCGAIRSVRLNRLKPDMTIVLSLLHLAKQRPDLFNNEQVVEALCSLLKKDAAMDASKSKGHHLLAILAANILMVVLEDDDDWPTIIVRVFLDDSFGDRVWVDHPECDHFVKNVLTAFGTKTAKKLDDGTDIDIALVPTHEIPRFTFIADTVNALTADLVKDRLSRRMPDINPGAGMVGPGAALGGGLTGKNLIRTLTSSCGLQDVRSLAVQKLEIWLQNPKLARLAQDLLLVICINCNTHSQEDVDLIGQMTKMRLKSKPAITHYLTCVKELIDAHPDNLKTLFSYVLYNELSNSRNPSNMTVVVSTLQSYPEAAAKTLASVCQDLLLQQEDYLRAVRGLLREIVRSVKHEVQFQSMALGMMAEPDLDKFEQLDALGKDRYIAATADLICLTMLLSITPQVKDAILVTCGKKKASDVAAAAINVEEVYAQSKMALAEIQHDALWWMHVVLPRLNPRIQPGDFVQLMQKILFLKPVEAYHARDNWPPEADRTFLVKACHDSAVLEDAILRIAAIGLSPEHPLPPADAVDLIGQVVRRACSVARTGFNPLTCTRADLIDTVLTLSQYHYPGNIRLPAEYIPPSLAISQLYWSILQSLLVVIALNPETTGHQAWTQYPMIKVMMEMAIVNRFSYPPVTVVDEELRNQMIGKEHQMSLVEKTEILEFESHLAAATTKLVVTEESSLLLSQLIAMDPQGHPRRPPDRTLEQLAALSSRMQIGVWLCRSRKPDFLLDIINRHGENQSMSWLPDLVASAKGDVGLLPVQCLCEFLLVHDREADKLSTGGIHVNELVAQLRQLLLSDSVDESLQAFAFQFNDFLFLFKQNTHVEVKVSSKVLQYFFKRCCSPHKATRDRSRTALALILDDVTSTPEKMEVDDVSKPQRDTFRWLLWDLIRLPQYVTTPLRHQAVDAARSAVLIEAEASAVAAYVTFLSNDLRQCQVTADGDREQLYALTTSAARMASQLLIDRKTIVEAALSSTQTLSVGDVTVTVAASFVTSLLHIFVTHIEEAKARDLRRRMAADGEERIPWSNSQDEISVKWPGDLAGATFHILVPHASVILLGYGPPSRRSPVLLEGSDALYRTLMETWFSEEGYVVPQAYLMDTQEEAVLLPDWLRLRMLRSEATPSTRRLAFAAVRDLQVEQLVLFIQSFGIPVESMNLLLQILDSQCETNAEVILNATSTNLSYMIRLIEVQRMRGCVAGERLSAVLRSRAEDPQQVSRPSVIQMATSSQEVRKRESPSPATAAEAIEPGKRTKPLPPPLKDVEEAKTLLSRLFSNSRPGGAEWKALLQAVNQRQPTTRRKNTVSSLCLSALCQLVETGFLEQLFNSPSHACCLLRALDRAVCASKRKASRDKEKLENIICAIYDRGRTPEKAKQPKVRPLVALATSWQTRNESATAGIRPRRLSSASQSGDNLRQSDWSRLEEFLRNQLAYLDNDEEVKAKVDLVAQILLEEIAHRRVLVGRGLSPSDDVCFTSIATAGLLIDWLQLLDPELLAHRPSLQRKLLFERNDQHLQSNTSFDQSYLLSLLVEHCNWSTIHSSIQWLLSDVTRDPTDVKQPSQTTAGSSVDPKTVLDFLWVVMQSPKIWKGRENKSTSVSEPVLHLTPGQFCRLLSYIVATTVSQRVSDPCAIGTGSSYLDLFSIYFSKFAQNKSSRAHLDTIIDYIRNKVRLSTLHCDVWWQLLAQLYVLTPEHPTWTAVHKSRERNEGTFLHQSDLNTFADAVATVRVGSNCRTDALVCSLLNRLGYVRSSSTVASQVDTSMIVSSLDSACDANLVLSHLASDRPFLMLRQLDLLSSMLRGRTRHDFQEFKVQHHLPLMLNIVVLLKQLSPYLFRPIHVTAVIGIMDVVWQMLKNYCHRARRQMLQVLVKSLALTHEYLTHDAANAVTVLSKHHVTFQVLLKTYSDHDVIVSLVTSVQSTLGSPWSADAGVASSGPTRAPILALASSSSESQSVSIYLDLMSKDQDLENVLQVLNDFDESAKRRVDDLTPYTDDLCRLFTTSRDPNVRRLALNALVRHSRSEPAFAPQHLLPSYLACLRQTSVGDDDETALLAVPTAHNPLSRALFLDSAAATRDCIQCLPDLVVLCRDHALVLLDAAFDAATRCGAALSYPDSVAGDSRRENEFSDVSDVLARCLWLLCGLNESDVRSASP